MVRTDINLNISPVSEGLGLKVTLNGTLSFDDTMESFRAPTMQPHALAISEIINLSEPRFLTYTVVS